MKTRVTLKHTTLLVCLGLFTLAASAQEVIEITKDYLPGKEKPIPVSLSGFSGEALEVIQFDLAVQGFTFTSPETAQYLSERQRQWQSHGPRTGSHQQELPGEQELHRRVAAAAGACVRG